MKRKYKNTSCIFEECKGHGSTFCLNHDFDYNYKLQKAKDHKVSLVCLRIANHKEKDRTNKIKTCMICGQMHNVNLHARREAFKREKTEGKSD